LSAHQIDVVIANEPPTGSFRTVLFSRRAGKFAVSFVAAPTLAKKYRRARRLDGFPVLVPTWESPLRRELDRWWADEGIHPDICAEFDDAAAMCEMAADGAGAAPLPEPMLQSARERFGLQVLPLRTGVHEELFVVTAERQFAHEGARILARVAGVPVRAGKAKRR
jgi:LysR family transcriptional activator of nhaA